MEQAYSVFAWRWRDRSALLERRGDQFGWPTSQDPRSAIRAGLRYGCCWTRRRRQKGLAPQYPSVPQGGSFREMGERDTSAVLQRNCTTFALERGAQRVGEEEVGDHRRTSTVARMVAPSTPSKKKSTEILPDDSRRTTSCCRARFISPRDRGYQTGSCRSYPAAVLGHVLTVFTAPDDVSGV